MKRPNSLSPEVKEIRLRRSREVFQPNDCFRARQAAQPFLTVVLLGLIVIFS